MTHNSSLLPQEVVGLAGIADIKSPGIRPAENGNCTSFFSIQGMCGTNRVIKA